MNVDIELTAAERAVLRLLAALYGVTEGEMLARAWKEKHV